MYAPPALAATEYETSIRIADWVELNLLTQEELLISVNDVTDALAEIPLDDSTANEHRQEYAEDSEDLDPDQLRDGYWQIAEAHTELAFQEMRQRGTCFRARYPFRLEGETARADLSFDSNTVATFLTLLRSRHLYHEALEDDGVLAGQLFEELLPHALRRYIDTSKDNAIRFGVAGGSRGSGLPPNTDAALDELSRRMNEARGSLSNTSVGGDFGGDSIVWKPLGDPFPGQLVAVGQSTISERKWINKQPSPKWRAGRLIRFLTPPTTVVAFVETMSLAKKSLLEGLGDQFSSLPLDRLRVLLFLRDDDLPSSLRTRMDEWSDSMRARLSQ